ncbi:MAG: hypothetical protein ACLVKO_02440 [Dysgonomonas sp.]
MNEIDKLIEEEAIKRAAENFAFPSSYSSAIDRETFRRGANFALSLNRWRKVEEELPKVGQVVVAKYKDPEPYENPYCVYVIEDNRYIDTLKTLCTEWQPII